MFCRHIFGNISGGFRGISCFFGNFAGFRGNTWISRARDRAKYQKPWLREGYIPSVIKSSIVSPLPKVIPPRAIESDLRPISLTCTLVKVMEGFTCRRLIPLLFIFFNQVSDLQLQWQLNQSITQSEVGLKQSTRLLKISHLLLHHK